MRKSRTLPLVLGAAFLLLALWMGGRLALKQASTDQTSGHPNVSVQGESRPSQAISPLLSISPAPAVVASSSPALGKLKLPTLSEVREQVAKDPHQTPPALIQFAKDITAQTEAAKKSPETARTFFETLENCVQNSEKGEGDSIPVPAQTLCLTTAEELAKLYPNELGGRLSELQKSASPEAKRIRAALDRFSH